MVSLCCVCLVLLLAANSSGVTLSTSAPIKIFDTPLSIPTLIALTHSAARTQTAMFEPAPLPASTLAPTMEMIPTATIFIFELQTNVARPTEYIFFSPTPFILSTAPLATSPAEGGAPCSCTGVDLDCKMEDFATHAIAQACFEHCKSLGYGDVYNIDGNDHDGLACENLP